MANAAEPTDDNPFELSRIRQLVRLMRDNDMSEIDMQWETGRLRLKRGATVAYGAPMLAPAPVAAPMATSVSTSAPATASPAPASGASAGSFIKSPIVGTYYSASSPDAEPFAKVGGKVSPETIICIIEAMKVFNEIPAGVSGTIAEILVENGAPVEYGQPLFRLEP